MEDALPYILADDPLKACLTHFGFEEFDIDQSIAEVNTLLDLIHALDVSACSSYSFEPLPTLASTPTPPSVEKAPKLELKPLPASLKYVFLGPHDTLHVIISLDLSSTQ